MYMHCTYILLYCGKYKYFLSVHALGVLVVHFHAALRVDTWMAVIRLLSHLVHVHVPNL